ncbi:hypothetical protein ACTWP5_07085 [Streptomyces sp. 4N509B]|uniref:hypothetical protein n=1 Tax=Streptomyces sp. 4N509B TaxID=3457413 RepID=UPI003FD4A687
MPGLSGLPGSSRPPRLPRPSPPSRYHLITPDDWFRIPLRSDPRRERSVAALVDRTCPARDQHAARRRELRELLIAVVERAALNDGVELYLATHSVLGVPIPASLLVSVEPENPALPRSLPTGATETLALALREKYRDRAQVDPVELPSGPAVRCLRRELDDEATTLGVPPDRPTTVLDTYLPVPGSSAWLLLTFNAPVPELAEAQVELFDVIAASLRWS